MAQITLEGPDGDSKLPNTGSESKENGWSFRKIIASLNTMFGELYAGLGNVAADRPLVLPIFAVSALPDAVAGGVIYVADGAAGDPILAFSDGTDWLRSDDGTAVAGA